MKRDPISYGIIYVWNAMLWYMIWCRHVVRYGPIPQDRVVFVCVRSHPLQIVRGSAPRSTHLELVLACICYTDVWKQWRKWTPLCIALHNTPTHPFQKPLNNSGFNLPTMQPSQPTAVTSVTIATMSDADCCKYCSYVGFVTTCNYCEYFANGGIHGVASLPAAFLNAGFTNTHFQDYRLSVHRLRFQTNPNHWSWWGVHPVSMDS